MARALPRPSRDRREPLRALRSRDWARRAAGLRRAALRGCSGELNLAPRAYHLGRDYEEVGWILEGLRAAQWRAAGGSRRPLGGNALLRCRGGRRHGAGTALRGRGLLAGGPSPPAAAPSAAASTGSFTRACSSTPCGPSAAQAAAAPGAVRPREDASARTLYEFDNLFTAPLHGFRDTEDYWAGLASRSCTASASRRWCSTRATTRSSGGEPARGHGRSGRGHALAARTRRARRLSGRVPAGPPGRAARGVMGLGPSSGAEGHPGSRRSPARGAQWAWSGPAPTERSSAGWMRSSMRRSEAARRAGLPRLVGPGRARRLVPAGRAGRPRGRFRVKGSRIEHDAARVHRAQLRRRRGRRLVLPERAAAGLRRAEAAPWVWRLAPSGDAARVRSHTGAPAQGRDELASTRTGACSSAPTWASASCTRRTCFSLQRWSSAAAGRRSKCRSPSCRGASATASARAATSGAGPRRVYRGLGRHAGAPWALRTSRRPCRP